MAHLCAKLADGMQQTVRSKTITLAVKMFGYAARIVTGKFVLYPMDVQIPVDSRLRQIYVYNKQKNVDEKKDTGLFSGISGAVSSTVLAFGLVVVDRLSGEDEEKLMYFYMFFAMCKCCFVVDSKGESHNEHEWINNHPVDEAVEEHSFDTQSKESER